MRKSENELTRAKYIEWQTSLFGACFIAFGLGSLFADIYEAPWADSWGIR